MDEKRSPKRTPAKKPRTGAKLSRAVRPSASASGSLVQTDPLLQAYLREIHKYPLLTKEEEHLLAVAWRTRGDREALQKLITSNLRFVVKVAYEYVTYRLKLLDLIQEGNTGLLKAVQEFDPYKEVRLTTYAVWWIRSYIQDAILRNYSLVKIGTTQAQKRLFYRLRKEQKQLEQMGLSPEQNVKLLASRLDVKEKEVREMNQRLSGGDLSLNAPTQREEKTEHLQNLPSEASSAEEELGDNEQRELFSKLLKEFGQSLTGREKLIFEDRLISENPITLQEIGDKYGVSKERARQLEETIKAKLKKFIEENYPDFDLLTGR